MAIQYYMRGYNTDAPGDVGYVDWVVNDTPDSTATYVPAPYISVNITNITVNNIVTSKVNNFLKPGEDGYDGYFLHLNSYDWLHATPPGPPIPVPSYLTGLSIVRGSIDGYVPRDYATLFWLESDLKWKFAYNTNGDGYTVGADLPVSMGPLSITNLSTGIVHSDGYGNLTSSLLVNADITTATIALSKLATQTSHTFVANNTGSTASPIAITATQATAELDVFTSSLKGLAPSSGGGTTNFLRADGTWATPASGGVTTVGTIDSQTKSANGLVIISTSIYAQNADATFPGLMSATTQTIAGAKTFTGALTNSALSTGVVHSGSGGAFTSSLLVDTDITAATITLSKLATQLTDTFLANVSGSTAVPSAVNLSTLAGAGLVFGTHTLDVTAGAGGSLVVGANDIQRAALTGAVVASQDSNATTFGVLAAKGVLANATNSSAVPAALSGSVAFQHLRVNSANTALEWSLLTAGDFPSNIIPVASLAAGTAGQFLLNNSTPTPTWTTATGDATISSAGAIAVTDITGSGGFVDVSSTGNIFRWDTATTAPGIMQTNNTTNSAIAASMTFQAQNATGTTSTGGALILTSGTGTSSAGLMHFQVGGATKMYMQPSSTVFTNGGDSLYIVPNPSGATSIEAVATATSFKLIQRDLGTNGATGAATTVQAQNATGTTTTGGTLALTSGTGTTAAGPVLIRTGGTTRLTANATGVITIANLSTGVVHADSSGNLTSSTIVNADVNASAAIDVSKLAAGTAGQVLMNNSTPTPTYTTISGDATLSSTGVVAVTDITGSGGFVDVASTGNIFRWATTTTLPGIMQTDNTTNSATAASMTIQSQNATGTTSTGGALNLVSGSGTSSKGFINIKPGGTNYISMNTGGTLWDSLVDGAYLSHGTTAAASGFNFTIQAQNAVTNGGNLLIVSGTGASSPGSIYIRPGNVTGLVVAKTSSFFCGASGNAAITLTPNDSGASSIQVTAGSTSFLINQADNTTNSATAVALTVQAQNATGTTAVGGNLILTSGTGTSRDGYVRLQEGGTTVASIEPNKFVFNKGRRRNISTVTTTITIPDGYDYIAVNASSVYTITLPPSPTSGDAYEFKDINGTSVANNVTITGNGHNIDGASTLVMNNNYASFIVTYTGTQWSIS